MVVWLLIASLNFQQAIAFKSHEECAEAANNLKVPAMCIAFAADIPDGKTL